MSTELEYIKDELEKDDRLEVSESRSIVTVESDEWAEIPATGETPSEVQVSESEWGFDVRTVNSGGERFDLSKKAAVSVVKGYLEGEDLV